jgi:hypothetical protein
MPLVARKIPKCRVHMLSYDNAASPRPKRHALGKIEWRSEITRQAHSLASGRGLSNRGSETKEGGDLGTMSILAPQQNRRRKQSI